MTLIEFLLARIQEDERLTWQLVPYDCEPGCCAPAGWVGHHCRICGDTTYGGTVEAITEVAQDHAERVHQRTRWLTECAAKRRIIAHAEDEVSPMAAQIEQEWGMSGMMPLESDEGVYILQVLAMPFVSHPDYQPEWKLVVKRMESERTTCWSCERPATSECAHVDWRFVCGVRCCDEHPHTSNHSRATRGMTAP